MMNRKKQINWCSKHQRVHEERTYKSCRYPNDNTKSYKIISVGYFGKGWNKKEDGSLVSIIADALSIKKCDWDNPIKIKVTVEQIGV